jgi:hypothetical protein
MLISKPSIRRDERILKLPERLDVPPRHMPKSYTLGL